MRTITALLAALFAGLVFAKLPPPTEEAKARAAETAAKTAWTDKVAAYKLCVAMDRTADAYRRNAKAAGKDVAAPVTTAPCTDPGPYVPPVAQEASKPVEAAGAHSPPAKADSPPSTNATQADIAGGIKK